MKDELDRARRTLISTSPLLPRSVLAAVGLGAAFGIGLLTGGIGEARGSAPAEVDTLGAARERAALLATKQSELKLAFPAELLAPEAKGAARPTVPDKPPAAEPPTAKPPAEKPTAEKPPAVKPAPIHAAVDEGEPAVEREAERPSIQATLAKVLGGAPPAASAAPAPKPKTFALQVASLPQRAPADELAKKLAGQGLHARVAVGEVGGREVYRVRVGAFAERDKAESAKSKLAMPAFIVSE